MEARVYGVGVGVGVGGRVGQVRSARVGSKGRWVRVGQCSMLCSTGRGEAGASFRDETKRDETRRDENNRDGG